jgi:hypothetical protein
MANMTKHFADTYCTILWILVIAVIAFFAYVAFANAGIHLHAQLFEDGSFIIGNSTGCIPFTLCN